MKATIELDDALYRRLEDEAARRGRTVPDLVAEGVRQVLGGSHHVPVPTDVPAPAWYAVLAHYAAAVDDHDMASVRASVATGRRDTSGW